jgi:hypothetical protein
LIDRIAWFGNTLICDAMRLLHYMTIMIS